MNGLDTSHKALFDLLLNLSFQFGEFTLASGQKSSYYVDGRMTTLSAEGARLIGEILYEAIAPLNIDAVGGMTLGADPIVSAISLTSALKGSPIPGFLIRKEAKGHGTGRQVEGHLKPGQRVVLVEDVITTGGSFLKAIDAVKAVSSDIEIVGLWALVDRRENPEPEFNRIPFQALYPVAAFLQANAASNPSLTH